MSIDHDQVRRFVAIVADPSHSFELRGVPSARSFAFRGDDLDAICKAAEALSNDRGIYFALNPNSITPGTHRAASASDVVRRRWLLIDVDSAKPSPDSNATEDEKARAYDVVEHVEAYLTRERGWPGPLRVDSGNGYHLLFRVDLPNTDDSGRLLKSLLWSLAIAFDSGGATIDRKVWDAPRICKLAGTWARKGTASELRPHRLAKIEHAPDVIGIVSPAQITAVVADLGSKRPVPAVKETASEVDPLTATVTDAAEVEARAIAYLATCPAAVAGQNGHGRTFDVARAIVYGFALGPDAGYRLLNEHYNPLCDPPWSEKELRRKCVEADRVAYGKPRGWLLLTEAGSGTTTTETPAKVSKKKSRVSTDTITLAQLMRRDIPEPRWAIPGMLSEGVTVLGGRAKQGKSWMALNLSITLAGGGLALGGIRVIAGDVLYLSLEDRLRRVQDRAAKVLSGMNTTASERLHVAVEWPKMHDGGLDGIADWVARVVCPRLVVIDVWAKFRPLTAKGVNQYEADYEAVSQLKALADGAGMSVLLIHHLRKAVGEDKLDALSGSTGIGGAVDGVMLLERPRVSGDEAGNEGTLWITGRDVEERELAIRFDPATYCWTSLGPADVHTASKIRAKVVALMRPPGTAPLGPRQIAEAICEREDSVSSELSRMVNSGILVRVDRGKYAFDYSSLATPWEATPPPVAGLPDSDQNAT